jgi:lipopolysaccharide transport system permease protein
VASTNSQHKPETFITPQSPWKMVDLSELWEYRELFIVYTVRNVSVQYKQTILGLSWLLITPIMSMVIFTVVFGNFLTVKSDDVPYAVFNFVAIVPWNFFTSALGMATISVQNANSLVTKVYFPRIILPISSVIGALLSFTISFAIMIVLLIFYQQVPTVNLIYLPLFILLAILWALGLGIWFSAINVLFRDMARMVNFIALALMYLTPVVYSYSEVPEQYRFIYTALNPMVTVVQGFRWGFIGSEPPMMSAGLVSAGLTAFILVSGLYVFHQMEAIFADVS